MHTEKGGRIYRPGTTSAAGRIPLGAVDTILSDKIPPQLRFDKVDNYILRPTEGSDLTCDLFWDPNDVRAPLFKSHISVTLFWPQRPFGTVSASAVDTTAMSKSQPIATSSQAQVTSPTNEDENFISYLRRLLKGPNKEWKKARTAGDILDRHLTLVKAIEQLDELNWGRSAGGYQIANGKPFFFKDFRLLIVTFRC